VAFRAKIALQGHEQSLTPGAMGIMAEGALVRGRWMNELGRRLGRVFVAGDAKISGGCREEMVVLRLMPGVTVGAVASRSMGEATADRLPNLVVTGGAEFQRFVNQEGRVIAGVRVMAPDAIAISRRWMDAGHVADLRGFMAAQAEVLVGRGFRASLMAIAAVLHRVYRGAEETLAGRRVGGVAGGAVAAVDRNPVV